MKKLISGLISIIVLTSVFTGCSSDSKNSDDSYSAAITTAAVAYDYMTEDAAGFSPQLNNGEIAYEDGHSGDITSVDSSASTASEFESKVIKNAGLTMESLDVNKAYMELLNFIISKGGTEFSRNMSVKDDETTIYATFKVLPGTLDEILGTASDFAEVLSSNVSSNDITSTYYDSEI
ncbi:MAG: DUF4349 domain-containing protein, partial [Oscillospiraceae bacterium]